jgi:AcrR family transcriptional regulator
VTASPEIQSRPAGRTTPDEAEAIVRAVDPLFYAAGVGVTTMRDAAKAAGISRGRLAKLYPTKQSLVVAYLRRQHEADVRTLDSLTTSGLAPTQILESALGGIVDDLLSADFRGCAFLNAAAETGYDYPEVATEVREHRDWYTTQTTRLLRSAGHPTPADAADDLILARDGGMASIHGANLLAAVAAMRRAIDRTIREIG